MSLVPIDPPQSLHAAAPVQADPLASDAALTGVMSGPTLVQQRAPVMTISDDDLIRHPVGMDWWLFSTVAALAVMGVVMAFSASYYLAVHRFNNEHLFLVKHLRSLAIATFALLTFANVPYQVLKKLAYPAMTLALVALILVPIIGVTVNRSTRWLRIGGSLFQPAELAKVAFVAYLARSLSSKAERNAIHTLHLGLLPHFLVWGVLGLLCMKQPDLWTALVLAVLLFSMTFVAGARIAPLVLLGLTGLGGLGVLLLHSPMRIRRILAFLYNFEHRADIGYQLWNSKLAVAMGGIFGRGLGASHQKLGFVPEAHTDFVLAIIGEELGLVGVLFTALCFIFLVWRGLRIALSARDEFGRLLALGLTVLFGVQASVNLGVVLGLLPTKGLTLPFVSYGGTSLIVMAMAAGILLNIGRGGNPNLRLPNLPTLGQQPTGNTRVRTVTPSSRGGA